LFNLSSYFILSIFNIFNILIIHDSKGETISDRS